MIYTLNARDNIKLQMMKQAFELNSKEIMKLINSDFEKTKSVLSDKGISYEELGSVLTPPHKSNRKEIVLCFDTSIIADCWYGNDIIKNILPYISKKRCHALFQGDFCVNSKINQYAFGCLRENISLIRNFSTSYCPQYFLVYINNVIEEEIACLVKGLESYEAFIGYGNMTYSNSLKDLLAYYLGQFCIQIKDKILLSHEDDRSNNEDINLIGYNYKKFGFSYFSIQSYYYMNYLEYKIESQIVDKADLIFSLNAISDTPEEYEAYHIIVDENKFEYIKNKNIALMKLTGIGKMQLEEFVLFLEEKIKQGYIYNLEINTYQVTKFNTKIECRTSSGETGRILASFEYNTTNKNLRLLNLF